MAHILFLSRWYPWPADNGSRLRIYNLLRGVAREHDITLLSFYEAGEPPSGDHHLHEFCREVHAIPRRPFNPRSAASMLGYLGNVPRSVIDTRSQQMEAAIFRIVQSTTVDCVIASQVDMAAYRPAFRNIPAIFEELELGLSYGKYRTSSTPWSKARNGLTWYKHQRFVGDLLDSFDYTTVASHAERQLAASLGGEEDRIQVLPNAIDLSRYPATESGRDVDSLLFTGSFEYEPNYRGMVWFQEKVYPLLAAERPALRVIATGKHGNRPLPDDDVVTRTGWIADIRPSLAGATCCIVPLLEGGGTRFKILEAMALRTPVVSTSKGTQGLDAEHGKHLLIADSPRDFANAVELVLASPTLAAKLGDNGYRLIEERYEAGRATALLLELIERTTSRRQRAEQRPLLH